MPMTIIAMTLAIAPIAVPTALVEPPDRAQQLAADVGRLALRHEAERACEGHQPRRTAA